MERRTSDISENILYPNSTKYLRIIEMLLCAVCIGLAFYVWSNGKDLFGAIVILFATSFGFLAVTIIDVMATLKRRQYSAPIWAGLAFLGAFMFFLSFGFMVLQSFMPYVLIGVVFAVTGIVFLLDGIIIIWHFFRSKFPNIVLPSQPEKPTRDEATQTEGNSEILEEVPIEVKRVAPLFTAPKEPTKTTSQNTSPRTSFPRTSYGGTFSVGGTDIPPLPTPDTLTGLEPAIPPSLYVPKRSISETLPRTGSSPIHFPTEENVFPPIREETPPEYPASSVPSEPSRRASVPTTSYTSSPTYNGAHYEPLPFMGNQYSNDVLHSKHHQQNEQMPPAEYNLPNAVPQPPEDYMAHTQQPQPHTQVPSDHHKGNMQASMWPPYQAAGEPQQPISNMPAPANLDPRYQREMLPSGNAPLCPTCAARATQEARDQVTPFVTHHYNQTPCVCGFTHYQASTVVKGAVRQNPQDTVQQQQRMIKDQLGQMRDSNVYQGYGKKC